jgi:hypothetical protein
LLVCLALALPLAVAVPPAASLPPNTPSYFSQQQPKVNEVVDEDKKVN